MDVTEIPFVEKVGITRTEDGVLTLPFGRTIQNHLKTFHASAQFTLAETASAELLQQLFPELVGKVVPVLRESSIKFKKPANKTIVARARVSDDAVATFREQLEKKGRALLAIDVEVIDSEDVSTCVGTFNWFVQGLE